MLIISVKVVTYALIAETKPSAEKDQKCHSAEVQEQSYLAYALFSRAAIHPPVRTKKIHVRLQSSHRLWKLQNRKLAPLSSLLTEPFTL